MSDIRKNKTVFTILPRTATLIILPLVGVLAQTNRAAAQISSSHSSTVIDAVGERFDISGGQRSTGGKNLFHSFEHFDLDAGQIANFQADSNVQNVIGSVAGGTASTIDGALQVSGSKANLYLMNPSGILFGPNARLNVSGGFTATTASGLEFDNEQFLVTGSNDYSRFVEAPTALQFAGERAGAVINLGELEVEAGQAISLVGGTVANVGRLEAPDGTVTMVAVEGEQWVRFIQEDRLLSLEVSAAEPGAGSAPVTMPASISEMITGSGLSGATALVTDSDGTVRLGSVGDAISEKGGSVVASGTLSTAGETGGNINLFGQKLSLETATLDASGNRGEGTIRIGAENIVVADSPTYSNSETTYLQSRYVEELSDTANVDLSATNDFVIEDLSDDQLRFQPGRSVSFTADADNNFDGEFIMQDLKDSIDVDRGNIHLLGAGITAGSLSIDATSNLQEEAGSVTVISSRGVSANNISSNIYFEGNGARAGGAVRIEAGDGDITVGDLIKTWSYTNTGSNAGAGGDVSLTASGNITVGTIDSRSVADKNLSGNGGNVALTALTGNVAVTGDILSGSQAGKNNAEAGGDVVLSAGSNIEVTGVVNTSSSARNPNTGNAGLVSLTAGSHLTVGRINANSTGRGDRGNIFLTGDRINLLGGNPSVIGKSIWFEPANQGRDINVGISIEADSALDISTADLSAIGQVDRINIGRADGTGKINLFSEGIEAVNERFPINILGGERLIGSEATDNYWLVDGENKGFVNDISFKNIGSLEGGGREDIFEFRDGGTLTGEVAGGLGDDTVDFTSSLDGATNFTFAGIENVIGRIEREETTLEDHTSLEDASVEDNSAVISAVESSPVESSLAASSSTARTSEASASNSSIQTLAAKGQSLSSISLSTEKSEKSGSVASEALSLPQSNATEISAIADIFDQVEVNVGGNFRSYLGLSEEVGPAETVGSVQGTLQAVKTTTGVTPALIYAYFVPDAESERAVVVGGDRPPQANDQLEIMLIAKEGVPVRKRQWGITREQVEAASRRLRDGVTSQFSTARQYLTPAQQLYDWLVRPVAKDIEKENIESLGFVMDDGLRTIPIAALHDGDRYLVEDYSVGLLPSFSLTQFENTGIEKTDFATARVLAMGASEFEEQPSLPAVDAEISLITQQLWQGDAFLNEDFILENLQAQIQQQDYGIVHLATHASFESGNMDNSYIQMWDDKLSLGDVKKLGLDSSEVGLIILSACNTALGDRASEYGFAGFAVTAGSQSALASLWPVSDEGTLGFMSQFYTELKQSSVRAEALRQAQMNLIRGDVGINDGFVYGPQGERIASLPRLAESGRWDFSHPFYWSAFTMIGNPW